MLEFIVPTYNAEKYIGKCIRSVLDQNNNNWKMHIINDASTDRTLEVIFDTIKDEDGNKFNVINNTKNLSALPNIHNAVVNHCLNGTAIALLDGDDWLAHDNVVTLISNIFRNKDVWIAWTQHIDYPLCFTGGSYSINENDNIKQAGAKASAMKIFRRELYIKINEEDLKDKDGKIYKWVYDAAITLPMLEMSGHKHWKYINNVAYVYNKENPLSINNNEEMRKTNRAEQKRIASKIRSSRSYLEIPSLDLDVIPMKSKIQIHKKDKKNTIITSKIPTKGSKNNSIIHIVDGQVIRRG